MPASKKRKILADSGSPNSVSSESALPMAKQEISASDNPNDNKPAITVPSDPGAVDKDQERKDRFKALQARAVSHFELIMFEVSSSDQPSSLIDVLCSNSEVNFWQLTHGSEKFCSTKPQRSCC